MGGLRTLLSPKPRHCMVQTTDSELLYIRELFKPESRPNRHSFSQSPFLGVSASLVVSMHSPVFRSYIYNFRHAPTLCYHFVYALFFRSRAACFRLKLHSSYARPAPKPAPMKAGHALRRNRITEKTTPKPRPMEDLTRRLDRQRSHLTNC